MKFYGALVCGLAVCWSTCFAADAQPQQAESETARAAEAMALGPQQTQLAGYLGNWDVEIVLSTGAAAAQHSKGKAQYYWVVKGRWLGCHITGAIFGQPYEQFTIFGYDSYAKDLVEVSVESADNAMLLSRGERKDANQPVTALFGELDEYTTGVLHRPYKVVLHQLTPNRHVTEVWGLDASAPGVKKIAFTFTRSR
jgi:hypothetical protein